MKREAELNLANPNRNVASSGPTKIKTTLTSTKTAVAGKALGVAGIGLTFGAAVTEAASQNPTLKPSNIAVTAGKQLLGPRAAQKVFGGGVHRHCGSVIEGATQNRRRRVVHDQRDPKLAPDGRHLSDGEHLEARVWKCLTVVGTRAIVTGLTKCFRIARIDEARIASDTPPGLASAIRVWLVLQMQKGDAAAPPDNSSK